MPLAQGGGGDGGAAMAETKMSARLCQQQAAMAKTNQLERLCWRRAAAAAHS